MQIQAALNGNKTIPIVCAACGTQLWERTAFCSKCGARIEPVAQVPAEYEAPLASPKPARSGRRKIIAVAVVMAVLMAGGLAFALRSDSGKAEMVAAVTQAEQVSAAPFEAAIAAHSLEAVQAVGRQAETAAGTVAGAMRSIEIVGSVEDRTVPRAAINGLLGVLGDLASLSKLDMASLEDWNTLYPAATQHVRALEQAEADLATKYSDAGIPRLAPQATKAFESLNALIEPAIERTKDWRVSFDKFTATKARRTRALNAYVKAAEPLIARYTQLRRSMGNFTDEVASGSQTYDQAYAFIADAASGRESVKNSLESLKVPSSMRGAHTAIVNTVDGSIDAVRAASEGLSQCQTSFYCYSYQDTPGWRTFQSRSSAISGQWADAQSSWKASLRSAKREIKGMDAPEAPQL